MVQIIQQGPTSATLRQRALDEALRGTIDAYQAYGQEQERKAATERQLALQGQQQRQQELSGAMNLRGQGYDVSPEQYSSYVTGKGNVSQLLAARTPEYLAGQEQSKAKQEQLAKKSELELLKSQLDIENAPLEKQKKLLELKQITENLQMSPIKRRQAEAELKKTMAESLKISKESQAKPADMRLQKMSAEAQNKVGSIASGIKALQGVKGALSKGYEPEYLTSRTPVIGGLISDNPLTQSQSILDEVIGRLQSGGAIGEQELKTFRSLGPRAADTPEIQAKKVQDQMSFLENKLRAYGMGVKDLEAMGFDIGQAGSSAPTPPPASKGVPNFDEWKKSKGL